MELAKAYEPGQYEEDIYQHWEKSGLFNPDKCLAKGLTPIGAKTFTIMLPPPNVTGQLHLGHAAMLAYEDLLIRYYRLQKYQALWLPGTDHAAIATQTKVEKIIALQGLKKEDLGRENFLAKVKEYVDQSKSTIHKQIRRMGSSLDWSREKYTLDKDVSEVVYKVFTRMYEDGLIYRGNRIVNWCPRCQSTLADDEVEYQEKHTPFYYFKYGPVVIGTARPETKFADKVIIVHPKDKRYQNMIGKTFIVPWIEGDIEARVIADKVADPELGTGAMTITPAHSFVDFELAQKYGLEVKKIIDEQGNLTEVAGEFVGQNAHQAREKIVAKMKKHNLVDHIDMDYIHNLSVCYRCGTPIEPLPSRQWFVDVNKIIPSRGKSLKQLSLDAVQKNNTDSGKIEIIPERFNKTYFHWMENLHDWCISRQIWWGHRIPVWYKNGNKKDDAEIYVGNMPPNGREWIQDEDTLDTWFSSALWTFSTLGWPDSDDFKRFHPTQVLETGYDIIFFWVARMILMTTYTTEQLPFEKVYLHGLVRDRQGKKMSKSLGNGIDPIEMIDKFGADALRLSMVVGVTPGNDLSLYEEKIAGYRNFVNKLWNISRFILQNLSEPKIVKDFPQGITLADEWILTEFSTLIMEMTIDLNKYNFSPAIEKLYEFAWSKLADWYLEIAKIEKEKDEILNFILQNLLILLHPFAPYVSETIWAESYNPQRKDEMMLMVQTWPQGKVKDKNPSVAEFLILQKLITNIRKYKSEHKISTGKISAVQIFSAKYNKLLTNHVLIIEKLARVKVEFVVSLSELSKVIEKEYEFFLLETIDKKDNTQKIKDLEKYILSLTKKLSNKEFLSKAPPEVVTSEKEKLVAAQEKLRKINYNK
jgi:valyl-tRNA synthetase